MATLCPPARWQSFGTRNWNQLESSVQPTPTGPDGSTLVKKIEAVWQHFAESIEVQSALAQLEEEIEYRPMLPSRSFAIRVNLQIRGRGRPISYSLGDDVGDVAE